MVCTTQTTMTLEQRRNKMAILINCVLSILINYYGLAFFENFSVVVWNSMSRGLEFWSGVLVWSFGLEFWSGFLVWSFGLEFWSGFLVWSFGLEFCVPGVWSGMPCHWIPDHRGLKWDVNHA